MARKPEEASPIEQAFIAGFGVGCFIDELCAGYHMRLDHGVEVQMAFDFEGMIEDALDKFVDSEKPNPLKDCLTKYLAFRFEKMIKDAGRPDKPTD